MISYAFRSQFGGGLFGSVVGQMEDLPRLGWVVVKFMKPTGAFGVSISLRRMAGHGETSSPPIQRPQGMSLLEVIYKKKDLTKACIPKVKAKRPSTMPYHNLVGVGIGGVGIDPENVETCA